MLRIRKQTLNLVGIGNGTVRSSVVLIAFLSGCTNAGIPGRTTNVSSTVARDPFQCRLLLGSTAVTGVTGGAFPVSIFVTNKSDIERCYTIQVAGDPRDCDVVQVSEDGVELDQHDPARLAATADRFRGGSAIAGIFEPGTTYVERVDLSHLFDFTKSGRFYFRFRIALNDPDKQIQVWSPTLAVIVDTRLLSEWQALDKQ